MATYTEPPTGKYKPGSARLGQVGFGDLLRGIRPGISYRFDAATLIALSNQVTNSFRGGSFQRALEDVHARAADVIAEGMVTRLESEVAKTGRPQRGTNWLAHSLLHERNKEWTANTLLVGRPLWLDTSPAQLYYRRIEDGDPSRVRVTGLFTDTNGPPGRAGGPPGHSPSWSGPYRRPGSERNLRLKQTSVGVSMLIGDWPAYRYSEGGRDAFDAMNIGREYKTALASVGIRLSDVRRTASK